MFEMQAENFYDSAKELQSMFAQKSITKTALDRLYNDIEQTYISTLRASELDRHPQWCVQSHRRAMELYLYQNWPRKIPQAEMVSQLNLLAQQMERDFLPSEGEQLSPASIEEIIRYLDRHDGYSEKVLQNGRLVILSAGCGHRQFDALSRPRIYQDNSFCCDIYLFHRKENENSSLESIFLHELGHVLNLSLTGDISVVPEDFFDFGEYFFPGLSTAHRAIAPEFFAHCFSMGITSRPEFQRYDSFPSIRQEHKKLFDAYMKSKIALLT